MTTIVVQIITVRQIEKSRPATVNTPETGSGIDFVVAAEEPAHDLADYQADRVGAQHRDDRRGIEAADHRALEHEAEQRQHERGGHDARPQGQRALSKR